LKHKKHVARQKAGSADEKNVSARILAPGMSLRRLWAFRIVAAVVIPLLVVGGLELSLRLSGYGYPTGFFLKNSIGGRDYYVSNDRFGYRFFPPALARTPLSMRMSASKPAHTYRVFVFGESAAMGDPDPSFGAWRYLKVLLGERFPGTDFEVVCVAMTAINSHVVLPIARECARHDGDLWIVYMGNNEMVGPFGAATVFGSRAPGTGLVRAEIAAKTTKTGQLVDSLIQRCANRSSTPQIWSGLNMFKDHQLRYDDPGRLRAYENFKINLDDILRVSGNAGVPVILSTIGSNLRDCAPFASMHEAGLAENQKAEWDGLYQQGIALESAEDYQGALESYTRAAAIDPQYAELHFRAGRCRLALTNFDMALHEFELARDDDTLAFRADSRINQIIKAASDRAENRGVYFLDAARMLAQNSPDGITGNELFYEHVHLNFAGNYLLGLAFAEQVAKVLPESILAQGKTEWASAELCDQRLSVSPWDRFRLWENNYSRVSEPPFTDQLNDVPRAQFYMARLKELNSQMTDEARERSRATYIAALRLAPDDYLLHENFAQFLDQTGDWNEAVRQEDQVSGLLPRFPEAYYKTGALLIREGRANDAAGCFSNALAIRNDYEPALNDLGLIFANQLKTSEAAGLFTRVLRLNPGYVEAYLDWGFMEQCEGKLDQAMAHYHAAADIQPNGPAVYFYQAVTLAGENHRDESITSFQNAIWMNPKFWQARYLLGGELAAKAQIAEAQAQFSAVVSLRPDFALAHLNDGVALAELGKLDDALKELQMALQLDPTNPAAHQNLDAVRMNILALKNHTQ
jgi:tetratricopeptide (TPR) repeat protein